MATATAINYARLSECPMAGRLVRLGDVAEIRGWDRISSKPTR